MIEIEEGKPEKRVFQRLFNEAWDRVAEERKRTGVSGLHRSLWGALNENKALTIKKNGYIVGCASYKDIDYKNEPWVRFALPTYGKDETGSRSWYYCEELQEAYSDFYHSRGYKGAFIFANPDSPVGRATQEIWGAFGKYFGRPKMMALEDVLPEEEANAYKDRVSHVRAFAIPILRL